MQKKILAVACNLQQALLPADASLLTAAGCPSVCYYCKRCTGTLQQLRQCMLKAGTQHVLFTYTKPLFCAHSTRPQVWGRQAVALPATACHHAQMQQLQLLLPDLLQLAIMHRCSSCSCLSAGLPCLRMPPANTSLAWYRSDLEAL